VWIARPTEMHRHDHAISGVDELLRLDPKMLEGLRIVSQEPQHSFVAVQLDGLREGAEYAERRAGVPPRPGDAGVAEVI
jgi:hypothetical protein